MNLDEARRKISGLLENSGIESPRLNAEHLISHVVGIKRLEAFLSNDRRLSAKEIGEIYRLSGLLVRGKPLSWVLKKHNFCGVEISIRDGVFVPRPETEELCDMVYKKSLDFSNPRILDFCAGSGAIGLFLAFKNKNSKVFAIEKMKRSYSVMVENRRKLGLKNYFCANSSDIDFFRRKFDILVSNPPYIPSSQYESLSEEVKMEPKAALISGEDGLRAIRYLARNLGRVVKRGGYIFIEVGEYYSDKLSDIFDLPFIKDFEILKDMNDKDRFVRAVYMP